MVSQTLCVQVLKGKSDPIEFPSLNKMRLFKLEHTLRDLIEEEQSNVIKKQYIINFLNVVNINLNNINYFDINLFKYLKFKILDTSLFYDKLIFNQSFFSKILKKDKKVLIAKDKWENWSKYRKYFTTSTDNWIKESSERIDHLRSINDKFKDSRLEQIIGISENIHSYIKDNKKVKLTKLEQFHIYYSDNLIQLLDDYVYQIEKEAESIISYNKKYNQEIDDHNQKFIKELFDFKKHFSNLSFVSENDIDHTISRYNRILRETQINNNNYKEINTTELSLYKEERRSVCFYDANNIASHDNIYNSSVFTKEYDIITKSGYGIDKKLLPILPQMTFNLMDNYNLEDNVKYFETNDDIGVSHCVCIREEKDLMFLYLVDRRFIDINEPINRYKKVEIKINYTLNDELNDLLNQYKTKIESYIDDNIKPKADNILKSKLISAMKDEVTDI